MGLLQLAVSSLALCDSGTTPRLPWCPVRVDRYMDKKIDRYRKHKSEVEDLVSREC